jgi:tetrahydromethanopterin S-methyltransferase subunit G
VEDKMFELISKMYSEVKQGFAEVNSEMKQGLAEVNEKIEVLSKQVVNLENDLKPKVETALDGYKTVYEKLATLENKVDIISSKVDKQEVEIRVIKGVK